MASSEQRGPGRASGEGAVDNDSTLLELRVALESDVGPVRELNEDYADYLVPADEAQRRNKGAVFLVADGMGGHQAGEVASRRAAERILHEYYADTAHEPGDSLVRALKAANREVYDQAQADLSKTGMGTTLVAAAVLNRQVYVANVGDSRAYLINRQGISQITEDHSWVEEQVQAGLLSRDQAERHPQRNLITRALGHKPSVDVDLFKGEIREGDVLLLCSDGLSGCLSEQQIASIAYSQPPSEAVGQLVVQAKAHHADDNISVIVVKSVSPLAQRTALPQATSAAQFLQPAGDDIGDREAATVVAEQQPGSSRAQSPRGGAVAWLQELVEQARLNSAPRQRLVVVLASLVTLCCLCALLAGVPALGTKFAGDPVAAPELAPIHYEGMGADEPAWWAQYLGYADLEQMIAKHAGQFDFGGQSAAELWPATPTIFVVGQVRNWTCQGQTCTFQLDMDQKRYDVTLRQQFFGQKNVELDGHRVRVFGDQAGDRGDGETEPVIARLIDQEERWWLWWLPAWSIVYQDHDWQQPVWVYAVADENPYSPVGMDDYPSLQRGDRILVRGKWLEGGSRDAMSLAAEDLYRLEAGRYTFVSGQQSPAPRPTVTLRPTGQ